MTIPVGGYMRKILPAVSREIDVGVLLDAFVRSRRYVPHDAHRIRSRDELPLALQFHTRQGGSVVWRAWSDGSRVWFVKAKPVSCEDVAGLQVTFVHMDGGLDGPGVWIWLREGPLLRALMRSAVEGIATDRVEPQRHPAWAGGHRRGCRSACSPGAGAARRRLGTRDVRR